MFSLFHLSAPDSQSTGSPAVSPGSRPDQFTPREHPWIVLSGSDSKQEDPPCPGPASPRTTEPQTDGQERGLEERQTDGQQREQEEEKLKGKQSPGEDQSAPHEHTDGNPTLIFPFLLPSFPSSLLHIWGILSGVNSHPYVVML